MDTGATLRWIHERCRAAGFTPDGLWSLKFYPADLQAILTLSEPEYSWTRNLAGSCWHQLGIDESTWLGCPFNPYYVAPWNAKAAAQQDDPQALLMLEWLTRDITACLSGGFPATFSLDPADTNRRDAGGFQSEEDALRYSVALIDEIAGQAAWNPAVVININEEARHYQTEGHDKDVMLDGMFERFSQLASREGARQASYAEVWRHYRRSFPQTPEALFVCGDLDWRTGPIEGAASQYISRPRSDTSLLYQDVSCQMAFLRSRGALPIEHYDYTSHAPDASDNLPYPDSAPANLSVSGVSYQQDAGAISVDFSVCFASDAKPRTTGLCLWEAPVSGKERIMRASDGIEAARTGPGVLFVKVRLSGKPSKSFHVQLAAPKES